MEKLKPSGIAKIFHEQRAPWNCIFPLYSIVPFLLIIIIQKESPSKCKTNLWTVQIYKQYIKNPVNTELYLMFTMSYLSFSTGLLNRWQVFHTTWIFLLKYCVCLETLVFWTMFGTWLLTNQGPLVFVTSMINYLPVNFLIILKIVITAGFFKIGKQKLQI